MTNKIEHYKTLTETFNLEKDVHFSDWENFAHLEFVFSPEAPDNFSPNVLISMMARVKGRADIYRILKQATKRFTDVKHYEDEQDYHTRIITSYIPLQYKLNAIDAYGSDDAEDYKEKARAKTLARLERAKSGFSWNVDIHASTTTAKQYTEYLEARYPIDAPHGTYTDDDINFIATSKLTIDFMKSKDPARWDLLMFFFSRVMHSNIAMHIAHTYLNVYAQVWPCDKGDTFCHTLDNVAERVEWADIQPWKKAYFYKGYDEYFARVA